jgi:hypothetical protein
MVKIAEKLEENAYINRTAVFERECFGHGLVCLMYVPTYVCMYVPICTAHRQYVTRFPPLCLHMYTIL